MVLFKSAQEVLPFVNGYVLLQISVGDYGFTVENKLTFGWESKNLPDFQTIIEGVISHLKKFSNAVDEFSEWYYVPCVMDEELSFCEVFRVSDGAPSMEVLASQIQSVGLEGFTSFLKTVL